MKTKCKSHTQQTRNVPFFDRSGVPMSGGGMGFNGGDGGVRGFTLNIRSKSYMAWSSLGQPFVLIHLKYLI